MKCSLWWIFLFCFVGISLNSSTKKHAHEGHRDVLLSIFVNWLESGGANLGKLKPIWLSGEGYTVLSISGIEMGEVVAYVPDTLFLGPKAASRSNLAPFISHLPAPDQVHNY